MEFKEKMLKINKHIYKQTVNPIYRGHDEVRVEDMFSWDDVFMDGNDSDIHDIDNIHNNTELTEALHEALKSTYENNLWK
jgi:hypothetical protein